MQQKAVVKVMQEYSEESDIGRGVRQGCCMFPLLFSLYAEAMMMEAMEGIEEEIEQCIDAKMEMEDIASLEEGIRVGSGLLRDVRFADDQAMVASTERIAEYYGPP